MLKFLRSCDPFTSLPPTSALPTPSSLPFYAPAFLSSYFSGHALSLIALSKSPTMCWRSRETLHAAGQRGMVCGRRHPRTPCWGGEHRL